MKKLMLCLAASMMLLSAPGSADWWTDFVIKNLENKNNIKIGRVMWHWVAEDTNGNNYYLDLDRIKKHDGYIYFWQLENYLKPSGDGLHLSALYYHQGDCKLFRDKGLSVSLYKVPMGEGTPDKTMTALPNINWKGPYPPDTIGQEMITFVCKYAEKMP